MKAAAEKTMITVYLGDDRLKTDVEVFASEAGYSLSGFTKQLLESVIRIEPSDYRLAKDILSAIANLNEEQIRKIKGKAYGNNQEPGEYILDVLLLCI